MNDDQNNKPLEPMLGMLEGFVEKAYIVVKEIPRREVLNAYGVELHIGEEEDVDDNV